MTLPQAEIGPHHCQTANSIVRTLASVMDIHEAQLVLLAALLQLATETTKPHEAIENFLVIIAQLNVGQRGPVAKAVLDVLAEYLCGERVAGG